jgi:hypothetical protein
MKQIDKPSSMRVTSHDPGGRKKPKWPPESVVAAKFSDCTRYRYELTEIWDKKLPLVMFLMMNPSVAGYEHADPTLIKCGKFARAWGCGGQLVGNVHAYRITDSDLLIEAEDPIGPKNDAALLRMARRAKMVVLAYGLPPKPLQPRAAKVIEMLSGKAQLKYLRLTKNGTPEHPLYLPSHLVPLDYVPTV